MKRVLILFAAMSLFAFTGSSIADETGTGQPTSTATTTTTTTTTQSPDSSDICSWLDALFGGCNK